MSVQFIQRLFTVAEYHRMVEIGIFSADKHSELIEGKVIVMNPVGTRDTACLRRMNGVLSQQIGQAATLKLQDALCLDDNTEPVPDMLLLKPRADGYADRELLPTDVLLLIEIADTVESYERKVKLPLYAKSRIPEVWLVNLPKGFVEVHSSPNRHRYQNLRQVKSGGTIQPLEIANVSIPVNFIV